jgi:hypothetical protein
MAKKPSYLGLLNAIAVGEARGQAILEAWAATTTNPTLAKVLGLVAIREREHAAAFTKRLSELGFSVRESGKKDFKKALAFAGSGASDAQKFEKLLGYDPAGKEGKDPLRKIFKDRNIDPATGALLGRFIAEERDSGRRLRAAYDGTPCGTDDIISNDHADLHDIAERLDKLTKTIDELKALRAET